MNKIKYKIFVIAVLLFSGCDMSEKRDTSYLEVQNEEQISNEFEFENDNGSIKVPYTEQFDNTITIPVKINGMSLDMIYDTGASPTLITLAEARYLFEKGKLSREDLVDYQNYQSADGKLFVGLRINLRIVEIGDKIRLQNIEAIVVDNQKAPLLLGQSVIKQFREVSVDMENKLVKFIK